MFYIVLVLDSTYKINNYCPVLVGFIGVTSTELTFSIAFAYMMSEKEDNVTWALERCCDLLKYKDICPKVLVTDRDNDLINVVDIIFPNAIVLLC